MKPFPLKLKDFTETLDCAIQVAKVEDISPVPAPDTAWKVTFECDQFNWAYSLMLLTVVSKGTYTVTEVGTNYVKLSGTVAPTTADVFKLKAPVFLHGTQLKVKPEWDALVQVSGAVQPVIYLQELSPEVWDTDKLAEVASRANVRLWFLLPSLKDWTTDQHYSYIIEAMYQLAQSFVEQLKYRNIIAESGDDYTLTYHANIGSTGEYGHLKDLINTPYSGVELRATFQRLEENCVC